ncbi:MAG TPA: mechanosensitive ion channel domain-containing protein [Pseudolabrys sp.]|jgi:small conductance mechanosensitive channel|nr:mechanosensitive ion channel domain-containing protein [Pseudolabrys sp.]
MTVNVAQLGGEIGTFAQAAIAWAAIAVPRIAGAIALLVAGWWFAGYAQRGTASLLGSQRHVEPTLRIVLASLVRYAILILILVAVLGQLGIQTTSILAALGAAGIAIGLALQGTLSNIAAGMMLLWLRPFRIGDYIDSGSAAGTVKELGLFATELHSWDGIYQFVPNSELWNKKLINYSRLPTRLNDLAFGVDYKDDLDKGLETLMTLANSDKRVLPDPAPVVFVDQLGDSSVVLRLRVWSSNADYWDLRRALTKQGKAALEAAGLSIPFPQRDLHIKDAPDGLIGKAA